MSLGTILFVNVVLGSLEIHWWIVLLTRKVVSPCAYRSKARTINELHTSNAISVTSIYFMHIFPCIQPCVGCFMACHALLLMLRFLQFLDCKIHALL